MVNYSGMLLLVELLFDIFMLCYNVILLKLPLNLNYDMDGPCRKVVFKNTEKGQIIFKIK